jgi:hypothetical protein
MEFFEEKKDFILKELKVKGNQLFLKLEFSASSQK